MIDIRLRSKVSAAELEQKWGRILTPSDFNILLTGATRVRQPNGQLLCIYLPGALKEVADDAYPLLTKIRLLTRNRGPASGSLAQRTGPGGTVRTARPVYSGVLGAMDPAPGGRFPYCRLTAYTARETDSWVEMRPLFQRIATLFEELVPDRYANQVSFARRTHPEWVIPGTPFTTITVNNTYSTGVHTDKGDLDEGFSCLGCLRRGEYSGGDLVFPEFRLAVNMKDGDLLLMDAHQAHGNTQMVCKCGHVIPRLEPGSQNAAGPCEDCGAERISIVAYYRTKVAQCGTQTEEYEKREAQLAKREAALNA